MIQPAHIQGLLSQIATSGNKELNANLPLFLRILSKQGADKYLVQLGRLVIETTSHKELTVGANYWASVKQGREGLLISDLIKQPKILSQLETSKLRLYSKEFQEILQEAQKGGRQIENLFKDFLLERLPLASSKQEFLELSNLLMALQNGVLSMVIQDEGGKEGLVQIKKRVDFLEFYSLFPNLGEISGLVSLSQDSSLALRLQVMSERIRDILVRNLDDLSGFESIEIEIGQSSPLWDLSAFNTSYVLDVRG